MKITNSVKNCLDFFDIFRLPVTLFFNRSEKVSTRKNTTKHQKGHQIGVIAIVILRYYNYEIKDELYVINLSIHLKLKDGMEWLHIGFKP